MSTVLDEEDLSACIGQGYGQRMGWPAGTHVQVTLSVETRPGLPPRVYATIEKNPPEKTQEAKETPCQTA